MEPNATEAISANCHHHSNIAQSVDAMEEGETHLSKDGEIKKNLGSLVKGNDTRKRDTAVKMDMNSNCPKEKGRKNDPSHAICHGVQAISDEYPPSKREIRKWRHRKVIIASFLIFTNDYWLLRK